MERFQRTWSKLEYALCACAGITLFVSVAYVTANVFGRYVINFPVPGASEWVALLMLPIVYFSVAYGWKIPNTFVAADFLLVKMRGKLRLGMELFIQICALLFFAGLIAYGSLEGARWTAILYSLVQSCRLVGIDPFVYFRDVLRRLPTHPQRLIAQLTPRGWAETFASTASV